MCHHVEISPLTVAIVAGAFGLVGVIVGQFFGLLSGWIQRRYDSRIRKRQQIDKIGDMMIECSLWFHSVYSCREGDKLLALRPPSQLASIVLFARLSFPALVPHAKAFQEACMEHYSLAIHSYNPSIPLSVGGQIEAVSQKDSEFDNRMKRILEVRRVFEDAIVAEAKPLQDL